MNVRNEKYIKAFGLNLKKIRKEKGITQEELSFKSELELSQIGRIERGVINTSISIIYTIANALEIHPKELFDFSE